MYKITVTKNVYVKAIQYNRDRIQGEQNARMQFGESCQYHVEPA